MAIQRKIIHCDCDCFYAAVEMRDNPQLRGQPVAVGGTGRRGVLSTCNYEARKFGVRSAMPTGQALRLCPDLVVVPGRFDAYREASRQIMAIFQDYSELIEPLSLDEAYIDVSECEKLKGSATFIAQEIKQRAFEKTGLVVSAGVAPNKFLAKIASDWKKPDGLFVITPEQVEDFVLQLPVEKIHGVGKVTASKLHKDGLYTCADIRSFGSRKLLDRYGSFGEHLFRLSHGIDHRTVSVSRLRKSLSVERTFSEDLPDMQSCLSRMESVYVELKERLQKQDDKVATKAFVKLKFKDFSQTTVECAIRGSSLTDYARLCEQAWKRKKMPVRLIGMGVRFRTNIAPTQLALF